MTIELPSISRSTLIAKTPTMKMLSASTTALRTAVVAAASSSAAPCGAASSAANAGHVQTNSSAAIAQVRRAV
jgi:hypothetical protein